MVFYCSRVKNFARLVTRYMVAWAANLLLIVSDANARTRLELAILVP